MTLQKVQATSILRWTIVVGEIFFTLNVLSILFICSAHVRKRLCIYAGFGLGDKILAHSLANVEMTNVIQWKFLDGCNFLCLGVCNLKYIRILYCNIDGFFGGSTMDFITFTSQNFL